MTELCPKGLHERTEDNTYIRGDGVRLCKLCRRVHDTARRRRRGQAPRQELMDRILTRYKVHAETGCWLWTGALTKDGYALVRVRAQTLAAHRVAYKLLVGPVADDIELDHLCHTRDVSCVRGPSCAHRRCINPDHLEPVTRDENQRRARANGIGRRAVA